MQVSNVAFIYQDGLDDGNSNASRNLHWSMEIPLPCCVYSFFSSCKKVEKWQQIEMLFTDDVIGTCEKTISPSHDRNARCGTEIFRNNCQEDPLNNIIT
jgi:hypothetical protein